MRRPQIEAMLADIKRIEQLQPYPVGHAGAWDEIRARASSLRRTIRTGQAADLATKIGYTVGYVVDARPEQEQRERGRLTDQLWRLRAELERILKTP